MVDYRWKGLEKVIRRQNQDIDDLRKTLPEKEAEIQQLRSKIGMEEISQPEPAEESPGKNGFWGKFKLKS